MTKQAIEKKYGVFIRDDSYWHPFKQKYIRQYKIYSADGCLWDNGLRTLEAVHSECEVNKDVLRSIARECQVL